MPASWEPEDILPSGKQAADLERAALAWVAAAAELQRMLGRPVGKAEVIMDADGRPSGLHAHHPGPTMADQLDRLEPGWRPGTAAPDIGAARVGTCGICGTEGEIVTGPASQRLCGYCDELRILKPLPPPAVPAGHRSRSRRSGALLALALAVLACTFWLHGAAAWAGLGLAWALFLIR